MRQRGPRRRTDRATIKREQQVSEDDFGEPVFEYEEIASDVPCVFDDGGTEFVRPESGERVQRPSRLQFGHDVDVDEGDQITVPGIEGTFEVVGIDRERDHRRARTQQLTADIERID